ncbi:hypothetical protein AOLI_G00290360 [Acnodon oligacanthus]
MAKVILWLHHSRSLLDATVLLFMKNLSQPSESLDFVCSRPQYEAQPLLSPQHLYTP